MKANDLRIGNWIKYEDKLVQVVQLSSLMILCQRDENQFLVNCEPKVFQPIELTEELLLKIGFELMNTKNHKGFEMVREIEEDVYEFLVFKIFSDNTLLHMRKSKGGGFEYGEFTKRGIKYLHELQNAYFLLTNQEMEIEL